MPEQNEIVKCPECGVEVREDRLEGHMDKVHGILDPAKLPTLEGEKRKVTIMLVAGLIAALIIGGWILYPVVFDNPNGDGSGGGNEVTHTMVILVTNFGNIEIEMFDDIAPITSKNFLDLVRDDKYDSVIFHRVINGFMIQGGDFTNGDGTGGHAAEYHDGLGNQNDPDTWVIPDEFHPNARNVRGTLSMANRGPDTGGSQFFINLVSTTDLNDKHAVFGKVTNGMDVVDSIAQTQTGANDKPVNNVIIHQASVTGTIEIEPDWYN